MKSSFLKYAVLVVSVLFFILINTCKKSTTSSETDDTSEDACEINIKVMANNIPDGTGSHNFGNVIVGESSSAVTFRVENLGSAVLNLSGTPKVALTGTDSDMFTVTQQPSSTIASQASTDFIITFNPTTTGTKTATVSISNNDANENPYNFTLNGTGIVTASTATEIAQMFQTIISVSNTSEVLFVGPIEQNTVLKENMPYDKNGVPDKSSGFDHITDAGGYFIYYEYPLKRNTRPVIL